MKIKLKVPATSANMGAGFDTLGIALDLYNNIEIQTIKSGLQIIDVKDSKHIPKDERNLIYRSMKEVFDYVGFDIPGIRITQNSQIPMTRGLGSSSACIIGGVVAANIISGRQLSAKQLITLAAGIEGHPDNVGPALYGGFCVSLTDDNETIVKSMNVNPQIKFALMIPNYFVVTKQSREVLPYLVPFKDAVYNISHASMLQAAFVSGDTTCLKYGVKDKLHQQYRKSYIPDMDDIFAKAYELGANASYLSGSGPTILSILDGEYENFARNMKQYFNDTSKEWECKIVGVNNVGTVAKVIE